MTDQEAIANAITNALNTDNEDYEGETANAADGLLAIARAINSAWKWLGNGDAATSFGALEALGMAIKEGDEKIADALSDVAEAIREHAQAIRDTSEAKES